MKPDSFYSVGKEDLQYGHEEKERIEVTTPLSVCRIGVKASI